MRARALRFREGPEVPGGLMSAVGTKRTCSMRRRMTAFGGKADSDQPLPTSSIYEYMA